MDKELLLDICGFLPEKYFISRNLIKGFQTRASFVDYERAFYDLITWYDIPPLKKGPRSAWHHKDGPRFQEYGPAVIVVSEYALWMNRNGERHRINGPCLVGRRDKLSHISDRQNFWIVDYSDLHGVFLEECQELDYNTIREIDEIWYTNGKITKCKTVTGKVISF